MSSTASVNDDTSSKAWWKYPYVWMVISGPLSVVFACIATAIVIARNPETLVAEDYYKKGIEINKTLGNPSTNLAPAQAARNHAQTGVVPEKQLPK